MGSSSPIFAKPIKRVAASVTDLAVVTCCGWFRKGSSLGRRLFDIQVVSSHGNNDLAWWQTTLRPAARVVLYFAFVQYFKPSAARQLDLVILPLLIEVGLLYTAASMTIADILSRTRVVNAAPPHPHSASARRLYGGQGLPPDRHP
jgi:uncharacterized RDD family membrane protein YckC